jgi:hypothetical protein
MGSSSGQPEVDSLDYYRSVIGEDYFKFLYNDCQFVVVNTSCGQTCCRWNWKAGEWWRGALAEVDPDDCLIIVAHHQLFNTSPAENDPKAPIEAGIRVTMTLYRDAGMDIYLHGHPYHSSKEIDGINSIRWNHIGELWQASFGFTLGNKRHSSCMLLLFGNRVSVQQTGNEAGLWIVDGFVGFIQTFSMSKPELRRLCNCIFLILHIFAK